MKRFFKFLLSAFFVCTIIIFGVVLYQNAAHATIDYSEKKSKIVFNNVTYVEYEIPEEYTAFPTTSQRYNVRGGGKISTYEKQYDEKCNMINFEDDSLFYYDAVFLKEGFDVPVVLRENVECISTTYEHYIKFLEDEEVLDEVFKSLESKGEIPISEDTYNKLSATVGGTFSFKFKNLPLRSNSYQIIEKEGEKFVIINN